MKKTIFSLLTLALLLSLASCGGNDKESEKRPDTTPPSSAAQTKTDTVTSPLPTDAISEDTSSAVTERETLKSPLDVISDMLTSHETTPSTKRARR